MVREWSRGGYTVSSDARRLDIDVIHGFLFASSIEHSLPFGLYHRKEQVGFPRVVTDYIVVAFLADVFVLAPHRGNGLGRWLVDVVRNAPELRLIRRWLLGTRDAHGWYREFGFSEPKPNGLMERVNPDSDRETIGFS